MIDHLYVREPLTTDGKSIKEFEEKRIYPTERKEELPEGLGNVVEQVLIRPDGKININDFSSAIKEIGV